MNNKNLKELTEKPKLVFSVVLITIILSILFLLYLKLHTDIDTPKIARNFVTLESTNFPTIQLGHYALWSVDTKGKYSLIKRFNSTNNLLNSLDGSLLQPLEFNKIDTDKFVITIEKEGDRNETPNEFKLFETKQTKGKTDLELNIADFSKSDFFYTLATPTDNNKTINEASGVWFYNPTTNTANNLPVLAENWNYELRLISKEYNLEIPMGTFKNSNTKDSSNEYSLTGEGLNFPGEDFLNNLPEELQPPLNLRNGNYSLVLSIEPDLSGTDLTGEGVFITLAKSDVTEDESLEQKMQNVYSPISLRLESYEKQD